MTKYFTPSQCLGEPCNREPSYFFPDADRRSVTHSGLYSDFLTTLDKDVQNPGSRRRLLNMYIERLSCVSSSVSVVVR